jgi:ubiquinone/menaquinone biosynthesis C-methylase UbiE
LLDARRKCDWIADWINPGDTLLEVGSGPGSVVQTLRARGHNVTPLDIADSAFEPSLTPVVYQGGVMPFEGEQFDTALVLTTLHHTPDPDAILREAARVARRVIVIEDVFETRWQEAYTKFADSLTNMEFLGHPHSNRNDAHWQQSFAQLGLTLAHRRIYGLLKLFRQAVYVLDKGA